jgi:hypothetical protein
MEEEMVESSVIDLPDFSMDFEDFNLNTDCEI